MKILAMKWRRLGDTVLWTAALEALLEIPGTELTLALPKEYDTLFHDDPRFSRRILLGDSLGEKRKVLKEIQRKEFDVAISFHASHDTKRLIQKSGAVKKIIHHHARKGFSTFSTEGIPNLGIPMSAMERDLNVVRALGWEGKSPETRLVLSDERKNLGRNLLKEKGFSLERPILLLAPGASRPAKQWSLEKWVALAENLAAEAQVALVVESVAPWKRYGKLIHSKAYTLLETKSLPELLGVISQSQVFVGSDSGAKHIAIALGIPTVTLFGPESIGEWHGYDRVKNPALQVPVLCRDRDPIPAEFSWCGVEVCPYSSHSCLNLLLPEKVTDTARTLLKK